MFFDFYQIDIFKALSGDFVIKSMIYDDELVIFYSLVKVDLVFEFLILL
jgi:hypothetical protein